MQQNVNVSDMHLCLGSESDVVVDELAPGHQHDGDGVVVPALVLHKFK